MKTMDRDKLLDNLLSRTGFDFNQVFSIAFGFFSASLLWIWILYFFNLNLIVTVTISVILALVIRGLIKNMRWSATIDAKVAEQEGKADSIQADNVQSGTQGQEKQY